uniref:Mitochondrial fission process protein 1 n=1 Tax=Coccolithus braarudii TaxID=221442 RepID=A0A7S0LDM7_9EUKA|mmetsp:Transcript_3494/g.7335  ORF Transcript_3494/g.7335 Transcript_3494/m.7335 type:complete len:147 (+) Transcript_3494:32-472(+)
MSSAPPDIDLLRTGLARYLGYANELGEAFHPLAPGWCYNASYAVAGTYVCADAAWRARALPADAPRSGALEAADTLLWQSLASVAIPGAVINRIVWAAGKFAPPASRIPTIAGLCAIPLIIKPIDHGVDAALDTFVRPLYPKQKEE